MAAIAVLGAGSFYGATFVGLARRQGHAVLCLARPAHDVNTHLDAIMAAVEALRPGVFVNFAALNMVAESWRHAAHYYRTNVIGITALAEALRQWGGLQRFVQVSTPEVYGTTETPLKEDAPFRPSTPYAVSRAAADLHLQSMHAAYGFPVVFTRTVNVYGPGQQPYRIVPKTVLSILQDRKLPLHGGGISSRAFIHVEDAAEATLRVALEGRAGETYHVATARQTAIRDLVAMICALMNRDFDSVVEDDPERLGKDMAYQLDDAKIRTALGWRDTIDLEQGLAQTVADISARPNEFVRLNYVHRP